MTHRTDADHWMHVTPRPRPVMARGSGSWIWDEDGRRYLDFVQGWAVNSLGHAPAVVRAALADQADRLLSPSPAFRSRPQLELADALAACTGLDRVFLCSSGAEANEAAIKLVRKWGRVRRGGAAEIVTTEGAFHGRTLATMAASGKPGFDALFPPAVPGFRRVPFGDVAAVARAIDRDVAAVMVEPIQGENGVVAPPDGYLAALRDLTRVRGVLLVLDEIQTGVGRTGRFLAAEHEGVHADIVTLGKGLGGGVPLAALLCREEVACFEPGDQGGTYCGNPLMAAVGAAVVRRVSRPDFLADVRRRGTRLRCGLSALGERFGLKSPEGRGLLLAVTLERPSARQVVESCMEAGLLLNAPRPDRLRFMPSLVVSDDEIDLALERLAGVLASL